MAQMYSQVGPNTHTQLALLSLKCTLCYAESNAHMCAHTHLETCRPQNDNLKNTKPEKSSLQGIDFFFLSLILFLSFFFSFSQQSELKTPGSPSLFSLRALVHISSPSPKETLVPTHPTATLNNIIFQFLKSKWWFQEFHSVCCEQIGEVLRWF